MIIDKRRDITAVLKSKRYEIFDMAHLIIKPHHMSPRSFYINVLRVYKSTSASKKMKEHIKTNYGKEELRLFNKSSRKILRQYLKLIVRNKI